ncbi:hypothetical protein [Virgibacillus chiguensis]|uniref:Uncharacterized protein n=1 Tax=Virgibacillus chiguensis TaxID=411959 RepID=A0A1M5XDK5_9BACI|nr:hypothetical protein [Virgibacillus chiguensis]SHH97866.1 hypothetical protein SAMN05421807_1259 [Virgibacillus chiguensis]
MWCSGFHVVKKGFLNNSVFIWNDDENYHPEGSFLEQQAIKDKNLVAANETVLLSLPI